ncbi:MAG: ribosome small subunit-dependent GTPase A [Candidatus Obscuribacter sp.]|nr:ribosome small subunit-dependent GTPase A [Candidatus Obscuribacter sp.]MBP7577711.1 ribosome small subunit-dependent GTPase A [Candidatus Obscuribacter sp.]
MDLPYSAIVLRSHAGGYLVHVQGDLGGNLDRVLLCQPRGRLKKERVSIVTGDSVELDEVDRVAGTAVIAAQRTRRNLLERPTLANVDQVVIVQALRQPDFSPLWCDRYLVHFQLLLPLSRPVICLNKCDLVDQNEVKRLRSIYEPLGYFVIFVSAKTGAGIDDLSKCLSGKVSVFAGPSGVGKSSILNILSPELGLKVGVMENDFGVGRHTTTASELYRLQLKGDDSSVLTWIADTPGFNLYDFLHPEPKDVASQFPEIGRLAKHCRFANCLHLVEADCAVLALFPGLNEDEDEDEDAPAAVDNEEVDEEDIEEDDDAQGAEQQEDDEDDEDDDADQSPAPGQGDSESIPQKSLVAYFEDEDGPITISFDRYQSYATMVSESQEKQAQARKTSSKVEASVKVVGGEGKGKSIPRLNHRYRFDSRRSAIQRTRDLASEEEDIDMQLNQLDDDDDELDER